LSTEDLLANYLHTFHNKGFLCSTHYLHTHFIGISSVLAYSSRFYCYMSDLNTFHIRLCCDSYCDYFVARYIHGKSPAYPGPRISAFLTIRFCRARHADHFGVKVFDVSEKFRGGIGQILRPPMYKYQSSLDKSFSKIIFFYASTSPASEFNILFRLLMKSCIEPSI
jgi:hypothetical protein